MATFWIFLFMTKAVHVFVNKNVLKLSLNYFVSVLLFKRSKMIQQLINVNQIDLFLLQQKCSRYIRLTARPYDFHKPGL